MTAFRISKTERNADYSTINISLLHKNPSFQLYNATDVVTYLNASNVHMKDQYYLGMVWKFEGILSRHICESQFEQIHPSYPRDCSNNSFPKLLQMNVWSLQCTINREEMYNQCNYSHEGINEE